MKKVIWVHYYEKGKKKILWNMNVMLKLGMSSLLMDGQSLKTSVTVLGKVFHLLFWVWLMEPAIFMTDG